MDREPFDPGRIKPFERGQHRELPEDVERIVRQVIDSAMTVHKTLGPGFLESVYENALCVELTRRGVRFTRQGVVRIDYRGENVGEGRFDVLVEDHVLVELKAVERLAPIHTAQALSYLKALDKEIAILLNFNVPLLKQGIKRIVRQHIK